MPQIMIRALDLDRPLADRVRVYARAHELSTSAAAATLLTIALNHLASRSAGGHARGAATSAADRSTAARAAAHARWRKPQHD
jgi:hypothetical protein